MKCDFFISIAELENILKEAKRIKEIPNLNTVTFRVSTPIPTEQEYLIGGVAIDKEREREKEIPKPEPIITPEMKEHIEKYHKKQCTVCKAWFDFCDIMGIGVDVCKTCFERSKA